MAFEIGKTYKTRIGQDRKVVAETSDGMLIVEDVRKFLNYRNPDGTSQKNPNFDLIDPDEPTPVEREKIAKCLLAARYMGSYNHLKDGRSLTDLSSTPAQELAKAILEVLRDESR
jgi:hypothetical protein